MGEIADLTSSKRVHAQDYVDSGIPFYRGKEISELREHKPVSEVLYITEEKYKEIAKLYGSPQVGDLLITAVGTIGNTWVVDNVPFYFKDGNLIWFKNITCNPNYLDYVLSSDDGQKKIDASAIGSNQKALTMVKLNELKFMFPNDNEQVKIADYFRNLDHLITLHQRKCEQTKTLKKYMLQKMFPQDGEKVPQIRFEGFTEDWEQRKVLDLLIQPITDGPHETPKLVEEGVPFISVDAIVDNKIDFNRKRGNISEEYDELCCKKYKPQFHDVYLVKSGSTVGKVAIVETTDRFNIWSPLAAMRCGEKTYPYFLYDLLQTKDLQAQVADKASNGTQPNLSMRELEKFPVSVPSNLEEQKKIGDYFRNLDHLITLHQRKCDELKEVKKFMLQNMFV